jgi:hypothetical protein
MKNIQKKSDMFKNKEYVINARTLVRRNLAHNDFTFDVKILDYPCYRVFPKNIKEVHYLQSLAKYNQIHVTETGNGVLVTASAIDTL